MKYSSSFQFLIYVLSIIIVYKQYLILWIYLGELGYKLIKYLLPVIEILLLIFADDLFLFPSVLTFFILIYRGNVYDNDIFMRYYKIDRKKFCLPKKSVIYIILLSPCIYVIINLIIQGFESYLIYKPLLAKINNDMIYGEHNIDYLVLYGITCIIAPLVEEFTFRVLIYDNWLNNIFKKKIIALLLSSLIFSFTHFELETFLFAFISGIVLCIIYDISGYFGGVILHILFNTYTFFGLYRYIKGRWAIFILIILILVITLFINIKRRRKELAYGEVEKDRVI